MMWLQVVLVENGILEILLDILEVVGGLKINNKSVSQLRRQL